MELFRPGELVALTDESLYTRGRVLYTRAGGENSTTTVMWELRPAYTARVTTEATARLRRLHESEEGMAAA